MLIDAKIENYYSKYQLKKSLELEIAQLKSEILNDLNKMSSKKIVTDNFMVYLKCTNKISNNFLPFLIQHNHLALIKQTPAADSFRILENVYNFTDAERELYYPTNSSPSLCVKKI